jgi:hypothetical protein
MSVVNDFDCGVFHLENLKTQTTVLIIFKNCVKLLNGYYALLSTFFY